MIKDINKQIEEEAKNIAKRIVVIENRDKFSSETDMRAAEYCLYKAIKEQRESSSWRKVSEKLPESVVGFSETNLNETNSVLVKLYNGKYAIDKRVYIGLHNVSYSWFWYNYTDKDIVEWKPID